jgi:superoxide reductase
MLEIMKCNLCGKLAMIIREGGRRTICCDQLMEKLNEQEGEGEKILHTPEIRKKGNRIRIRIPGVADPMEPDHYIEWIEVIEGPYLQSKQLRPGDAPEAEFTVTSADIKVRAYCEEHGLWVHHLSPTEPERDRR